jgi:hypothetical protein
MPISRPALNKIAWTQVEELRAIDPRAAAIAYQILDYTEIRNKDLGILYSLSEGTSLSVSGLKTTLLFSRHLFG